MIAGRERRRTRGLLPRPAEVLRPEHGRAEVAGRRGEEERAAIAWVEHEVLRDVAEEGRTLGRPAGAGRVGAEHPPALPGPDEQARAVGHAAPPRWSDRHALRSRR